jgi:iron(III) transport system substrate-binding protein
VVQAVVVQGGAWRPLGYLYTCGSAQVGCAAVIRRTLAIVVAVAAIALPACSDDGGDRLTIYSGRTENLVGPLLERFNEETGVKIDVRYGDSADLALLVDQEGDRSPADVFLSQSPGAIGHLAIGGRLAPLPDEILDRVEGRFRDPDGLWVGLSGRIRVLVYNTELVEEDELPASVFDLTDGEYRGRVAVAPTNGSFQDFVTAMRAMEGDDRTLEWLQGMAGNDSPVYANNNAIVQAVGRGEVPMGLVNHYYALRAVDEDPDLPVENHFFPGRDVGGLILETGVGILAAAAESEDAQRFVQFLLEEEAQTFFSEETFEYPLAAGVEPAAGLAPLDDIPSPEVPLAELEGGLRRTQERESRLSDG